MKQLKRVIVLLVVVCAALIYATSSWPTPLYQTKPNQTPALQEVRVGAEGVSQRFVAAETGLHRLRVQAALQKNQATGAFQWRLYDETAQVAYEGTQSVEAGGSTQWWFLELPEATKMSVGNQFVFQVTQSDNVVFFATQETEQVAAVLQLTPYYHRLDWETCVVFCGVIAYLFGLFWLLNRLFR